MCYESLNLQNQMYELCMFSQIRLSSSSEAIHNRELHHVIFTNMLILVAKLYFLCSILRCVVDCTSQIWSYPNLTYIAML